MRDIPRPGDETLLKKTHAEAVWRDGFRVRYCGGARDGNERKHTGRRAAAGGDGPHRHPDLPAVPHHGGREPDGHHHAQQHGGYAAVRVLAGGAVHQPVPDLLHGYRHGRFRADFALLGQPGYGLAEKERGSDAAAQRSVYRRVYGGHGAVPKSGHADVHAGQRHHRLREDIPAVDAAHVFLHRPVPDLHHRTAQRGAGGCPCWHPSRHSR